MNTYVWFAYRGRWHRRKEPGEPVIITASVEVRAACGLSFDGPTEFLTFAVDAPDLGLLDEICAECQNAHKPIYDYDCSKAPAGWSPPGVLFPDGFKNDATPNGEVERLRDELRVCRATLSAKYETLLAAMGEDEPEDFESALRVLQRFRTTLTKLQKENE